jgi:aminocarboxymuconate-semialdehyde decarboxylase
MRDILGAIEESGLTIFLHPHYGVGNEHYKDAGHALFLALGFPFETTVSISRLIGKY